MEPITILPSPALAGICNNDYEDLSKSEICAGYRHHLPYSTVGPPSIPMRQHINNGFTRVRMGMPFKPSTMSQGSTFSNARQAYIKDAGGGQNWNSSSDYIRLRKINAIGQSSTKQGLARFAPMSFRSQDRTFRNSALARVRGGGCVAPKKKGAIRVGNGLGEIPMPQGQGAPIHVHDEWHRGTGRRDHPFPLVYGRI